MRRTAAVALATALAATGVTVTASAAQSDVGVRLSGAPSSPAERLRDVMFVGSNWEGTATVVDARTHRPIRTINTIPDRDERMAEILAAPDKLAFFHASIGRVYTPTDRPVMREPYDTLKGEQYFQIVRTDSLQIQARWDMGRELEEAGYPGMASAVRPTALAPDERFVYLQVSFIHRWIEFDTQAPDVDGATTYDGEPAVGAVTRVVDLPQRTTEPREPYVLDSAHHGLAMNPAGTTLCAAGTMDGYAAIVDRDTEDFELIDVGDKPYWATNGVFGDECWVSVSGEDKVVVIDYATAEPVATIAVGDHPQRVRAGVVAAAVLRAWTR